MHSSRMLMFDTVLGNATQCFCLLWVTGRGVKGRERERERMQNIEQSRCEAVELDGCSERNRGRIRIVDDEGRRMDGGWEATDSGTVGVTEARPGAGRGELGR